MVPNDLLNKFQVCQEALENGSSLEAVLSLYPQDAPRLRPLLETAQALSLLRPDLAEANAARAEVWRRIEDRLPYRQAQMRRQRQRLLWASAASLLILSAAIFVWFNQAPQEDVAAPIAATLTAQTTPEATEEATSTPTRTPSSITSATRTPSATISATSIPRPTIGTEDKPLLPEEYSISGAPTPVAKDVAEDDDSLPVQENDSSDDDNDNDVDDGGDNDN